MVQQSHLAQFESNLPVEIDLYNILTTIVNTQCINSLTDEILQALKETLNIKLFL
jgi:hypothetical protein